MDLPAWRRRLSFGINFLLVESILRGVFYLGGTWGVRGGKVFILALAVDANLTFVI